MCCFLVRHGGHETRPGKRFPAPGLGCCLHQAGNACRQAFPGWCPGALSARCRKHVQARVFLLLYRITVCDVQETLAGTCFLAGALQHCSQDAAHMCKHVLFGGLFASASQNCIWSVPASVFATLYSKVSRRFKETLACTCFVEGCFPGHRRSAENACPQAFSRSCFERHRGFPRKHWPASVLRRFVSQCIAGMQETLACKRFVESLFLHTVLANYNCLQRFCCSQTVHTGQMLCFGVKYCDDYSIFSTAELVFCNSGLGN